MIAIVIVTGRDSIRITISIRNTSIVIMSVYSVLLLLLKLEQGIIKIFNYILIAVIFILIMVIIITHINIREFRIICSRGYIFSYTNSNLEIVRPLLDIRDLLPTRLCLTAGGWFTTS